MLDDKEIIEVTNKSGGTVIYSVPDMNGLERLYRTGETKKVTMEELRKISYTTGGAVLLRNYLTINNKEAIAELLGVVEPEYFYTKQDILTLLSSKGTLEQLEDFLNFAPEGSIALLKDLAVSTKLNDVKKRKLILDKTEFNVSKAIELTEDEEEDTKKESKTRKAAPIKEDNGGRKAKPLSSKYNVVD